MPDNQILAIRFLQKSSKLSYLINDRIQKIRITPYPFRLEVDPSISKPDRFQFKERSTSSAAYPRSEFSVIRRLPSRTLRTAKDVVETILLCEG